MDSRVVTEIGGRNRTWRYSSFQDTGHFGDLLNPVPKLFGKMAVGPDVARYGAS
jgi:hypothetical protein